MIYEVRSIVNGVENICGKFNESEEAHRYYDEIKDSIRNNDGDDVYVNVVDDVKSWNLRLVNHGDGCFEWVDKDEIVDDESNEDDLIDVDEEITNLDIEIPDESIEDTDEEIDSEVENLSSDEISNIE